MTVVGMILAAGASRRFGPANKLLVPFHGKALVRHAAKALQSAKVDELIAIVSDQEVAAILPEFFHIPGWPMLSQNIATGAQWAKLRGATRLLLLLGDMPFVTAVHCNQLIEKCTDGIPSASSAGGIRSPPACFPSAKFNELIGLKGDFGAKALIEAIPSEAMIDRSDGELFDIDTAADLAALG